MLQLVSKAGATPGSTRQCLERLNSAGAQIEKALLELPGVPGEAEEALVAVLEAIAVARGTVAMLAFHQGDLRWADDGASDEQTSNET